MASDAAPLDWSRALRTAATLGTALGGAALGYVGYRGARELMHPAPQQAPSSLEAFELAGEAVVVPTADGLNLSAWYVPSRTPTHRAVALFHGHSAAKAQLLPYAKFLSRHFNCLLTDFRAAGDSEGPHSSMGYFEARDVRASVRYLLGRGHTHVGAWGMSMGGAAALRAAVDTPEIRCVITEGTFDRMIHVIEKRLRVRGYPAAPVLARAILAAANTRLGVDLAEEGPVDFIARLSPRPVFVIHGTADATSVVENGHRLFAAARHPKELMIVPDAAHTACYDVAPREYEARVIGFLERHLT